MSQETPLPGPEDVHQPLPRQENALLAFLQQPRILLIMLAAWSLLGFVTELLVGSALFVERHGEGDIALDGLLGGLVFNWQGLPLAVLYFYCARDPDRYRPVFWLALVSLSASVAAALYHWLVADTYSIESVFLPIAVSTGLGVLVFLHLFGAKEPPPQPVKA
jgi:hypothetical protein